MQSRKGSIADFVRELRTGWRDLIGATLGLACGAAMYTPIQSLFFRALEQEFHWSRATLAFSLIALPVTAIIMPAVGRLIDHFGVRRVAVVSAAMMSLSFLWLSTIGNSPLSFYAGFVAFNALGAATTPIGYTRPVAQSFRVLARNGSRDRILWHCNRRDSSTALVGSPPRSRRLACGV